MDRVHESSSGLSKLPIAFNGVTDDFIKISSDEVLHCEDNFDCTKGSYLSEQENSSSIEKYAICD